MLEELEEMQERVMVEISTGNVQIVVELAHTMKVKAHPFRRGASD